MTKSALLRKSLDLLYFSGAARALSGAFGGMGAIFMLHHVRPGGGSEEGFAPNAGLEITPSFLDAVIRHAKARSYALLSLAEAVERIKSERVAEPFAVFTIDDAYYDIYEHAWPVFRRHRCPFTVFVSPAIAEGKCELWWRGLEAVIAGEPRIAAEIGGVRHVLPTVTDAQKQHAFEQLYRPLRNMPEHQQRQWIGSFCAAHGIDLQAMCRAEAMSWTELRDMAADPLCTLGAHTVNHFALAKLAEADALREAVDSRARIVEETGAEVRFFAYPYGDATSAGPRDFALIAEAGFEAAVTTRKGLIYPAHRHHLTALPRVSLNGGFQKLRYVDVLLSGTAFAMWNGFKRVAAA
jgi:peptidoglycan/xylan/chitin deacetylase (PgdA/CDA1 family)